MWGRASAHNLRAALAYPRFAPCKPPGRRPQVTQPASMLRTLLGTLCARALNTPAHNPLPGKTLTIDSRDAPHTHMPPSNWRRATTILIPKRILLVGEGSIVAGPGGLHSRHGGIAKSSSCAYASRAKLRNGVNNAKAAACQPALLLMRITAKGGSEAGHPSSWFAHRPDLSAQPNRKAEGRPDPNPSPCKGPSILGAAAGQHVCMRPAPRTRERTHGRRKRAAPPARSHGMSSLPASRDGVGAGAAGTRNQSKRSCKNQVVRSPMLLGLVLWCSGIMWALCALGWTMGETIEKRSRHQRNICRHSFGRWTPNATELPGAGWALPLPGPHVGTSPSNRRKARLTATVCPWSSPPTPTPR